MNTNSVGLERMWVHKQIASLYFYPNIKLKLNTVLITIDFLNKALLKATNEGFIDVVVHPYSDEGDSHSMGSEYINVEGWRLETDKEYKDRLTNLMNHMIHDKKSFDTRKSYYDTDAHTNRLADLKSMIDKMLLNSKD